MTKTRRIAGTIMPAEILDARPIGEARDYDGLAALRVRIFRSLARLFREWRRRRREQRLIRRLHREATRGTEPRRRSF